MEFSLHINDPLLSILFTLSVAVNIGFTIKIAYHKIVNSNQIVSNSKDSNPVQFGAGSSGNTVIQNIINKDPEKYKEVTNEIEEKGEALQSGELDLGNYFKDLESKSEDQWNGAKTGYTDIDKMLDTFTAQLIILASLPTGGRTTMVTDIARYNAIVLKLPVFVFSMGSKAQLMIDRLISAEAGVDPRKLSLGKLNTDIEFEQVQNAMQRLREAPIFIDDALHANAVELRKVIQNATKGNKVGLVIVDGIELLTDYQKDKTSTLIYLRRMAIELDIPVIITVPFPRDPIASRGGHARLTDLPEAFGQIADVVIGLSPARHMYDEDDHITKVSVLKNRNGQCGMAELYYDDKYLRFVNLEKSVHSCEDF